MSDKVKKDLPWNIQTDSNGWLAIERKSGLQVLRFGEEDDRICQRECTKISLVDAEYVVTAANNHFELIEVLKLTLSLMKQAKQTHETTCGCSREYMDMYDTGLSGPISGVIEAAIQTAQKGYHA